MDIMKPVASTEIPKGDEWVYEVKYDGFRCVLTWEKEGNIRLTSRNRKDLTANFPEIVAFCEEHYSEVNSFLPLKLDAELVVLNHAFQANFSWIQKRGRLKNTESIHNAATTRPAVLMVFDLVEIKGISCRDEKLTIRKKKLKSLFGKLETQDRMRLVESFSNAGEIQEVVFHAMGEGIVAKRKTGIYLSGKSHRDWFKIKNWRTIQGFLTTYNPENGYFAVGVFEGEHIKTIGKCKHGLDSESFQTLKQLFLTNGKKKAHVYSLPPAICAAIHTLDLYKNELREPEFAKLLPTVKPEECTSDKLKLDLSMLPHEINLTNTDKFLWPKASYTKGDFLTYIRGISAYMLPFLLNRMLTVIRCPDGVDQEHFFQKHLPDYAPDFITAIPVEGDKAFVCDNLASLVWFANHGSVEYHIPFQKVYRSVPAEIVFDLDPPDRDHFHLAIRAANLIKTLLDDLQLVSFVKTSGNKGLQIHIPIREGSMTYEETATFTQAIAWTIENSYPDLFTTERMKKKRHDRLYIDYVQHGKDKTIIAPYSPRMTDEGTIATPLFWNEVKEGLLPTQFTLENGIDRVQELGCPFADYFKIADVQKMDKVLRLVRE
ncbi:DNA ligase D [Oceanobacillus saliphilus]|uniref:DNA ligase D n=1 Tax=Oceanobacillus saliphilus TaxID=2925834 RepID=UPI00201DF646|nr:DNA ligase D [Oceanobacillus saliphilus]